MIESFGQHYHPVNKSVKLPFNNGVNIATANAAQVKAVFDGEVRQFIVMPGYNQCVLIQQENISPSIANWGRCPSKLEIR